jgi:hypothetical protein
VLDEETEHGLEADMPHRKRIRVAAEALVRVQEVGAGDRCELATPAMKLELDVRERLEQRPETRTRLPGAFRDRAHPTLLLREQVQDPVGLTEAQRAQDDSLRPECPGHGPSVGSRPVALAAGGSATGVSQLHVSPVHARGSRFRYAVAVIGVRMR